jgi:hypothetical protein
LVRTTRLNLHWAALLAVSSLVVHDLRVVAGYGHDAEFVLATPGHAYLPFATGFAVLLAIAAAVQFARALTRPGVVAASFGEWPLVRRWLVSSALLTTTYLAQAAAESLSDPGHPIVGHGGWSVLPLSLAMGLVVAAATREADRVLCRAPVTPTRWHIRVAMFQVPGFASPPSPRRAPLASQAAGRAPPLAA